MARASSPEDFIVSIPAAEHHIQATRDLFGKELDYSGASIAELDGIIEEGWSDGSPILLESTVLAFGCYLGEAIRRNLGGVWGYTPEHGYPMDQVGGTARIFPFAKVRKRFQKGAADSLAFYYQSIKHVVESEP
jgi:hypothetical protein